jgi:hypothetical protein
VAVEEATSETVSLAAIAAARKWVRQLREQDRAEVQCRECRVGSMVGSRVCLWCGSRAEPREAAQEGRGGRAGGQRGVSYVDVN